MPPTMSRDIASVLIDQIALPDRVAHLSNSFRAAKPFPHIVIDNMFSNELLDHLTGEMPSMNADHWVHENNEQLEKYILRSAVELGKSGFQLAALLHSASFLYLLSELTGIWELLPDPYLQGSGYHLMPRGSKFDVHVDRNTAYETGLTRRLSLIIYLNKNWKPEYGGQLELWNSDATRREAVVEPIFNRTVIFEIAEGHFHGVPNIVACPKGRSRNCFLVYYHTVGNKGRRVDPPHSSIYAPSFYRREGSVVRKVMRDLAPPILLRTLQKMRDQRKLAK
jgi:Rps23 Pro-64 3,4-dihydroxylase Tpa1-like proline 4-hydroxylase